jgi:hypothetical protein
MSIKASAKALSGQWKKKKPLLPPKNTGVYAGVKNKGMYALVKVGREKKSTKAPNN